MSQPADSTDPRGIDPSTWVDEFGDYLYGYAVTRLRDGNSAEEVVQQSLVAAFTHIGQFSGRGPIRAWLLGILKRKIIDFVRQRNRTDSLSDDSSPDVADSLFKQNGMWTTAVKSEGWKQFDSLEREEFWQILQACLDGLPSRQADVFALREMDDRSTEEICKVLDISASNLWVLLHRARVRLAVCMNSRWNEDE
jgi:RNA polymerase sigma-70 factor (ECF subfamily)